MVQTTSKCCKYCRSEYEEKFRWWGGGYICQGCWELFEHDDGVNCHAQKGSGMLTKEQEAALDGRISRLTEKIKAHRIANRPHHSPESPLAGIREYTYTRVRNSVVFQ